MFSVKEMVLYRTGTYFCMDKSVTAVVIKVSAPTFCVAYSIVLHPNLASPCSEGATQA